MSAFASASRLLIRIGAVWLIGLGSVMVADSAAAADAPTPKGEVQHHVFDQSKVFPGTTRDYWIYIPKQYDPAKPACLYVNQDGIQNKAPEVFDDLISKGEMPIVIGVFITPGKVKARSDEALDRFNRSYEYDGLGAAYLRFLNQEILPEVERKTAADGRALRISTKGDDRAIGGSSSGAVCAFTAAWEGTVARELPGSFHRVFSTIGTYVGLRGGNVYPTLIRKYEPKPLRVFLQDGSSDLNIYGGDWWMANQEMERALTFAGYEVQHDWGDGGHNGQHAGRIFPDAMRWLWKDWPNAIKAGQGSAQLQEIVVPGEGWAEAADKPAGLGQPRKDAVANHKGVRLSVDLKNLGGLTLSPDQSLVYAADAGSRWVYSYQVQPDGALKHGQKYYHLHVPDDADDAGAGGLCVDRDGRLYVATRMGIQVCDQAGRVNVIIPTPQGGATDVVFGGPDRSVLYVESGGGIYKRKLNTQGVDPAAAPIKPKAPRL